MSREILIPFVLGMLAAAPLAAQHPAHEHAGVGDHTSAGLEALDPETRAIAESQLDQVRAATARYRDHAAAEADGYRRFEPGPGDPLMGEHWYRPDRVRAPLDLARPSTLIYARVGGERKLVAVAYTVRQEPGRRLPEGFAGEADRWHVHGLAELARITLSDRPVLQWVVENRLRHGPLGRRMADSDLVMLHAWIGMENPDGIFANRNTALPYARAGLPIAWSDGEPAARGVALLLPGACEGQIEALDRMARLERDQEKAIAKACEVATAEVDAARDRAVAAGSPTELNAVAARVFASYAWTVERVLTGEQEERLAALRAATRH
jgi:hypothetical protein